MDFENQSDEEEGLPKWPFLASAIFIFCGAIGFAYFHYHTSGLLEVWQLLVCILASGIGSLLIFMPFLLERSLHLCLLTANRKDDELFRKVYFDLKEVRNELEALAVKIDKVPTLVNKIVSDSTKDFNQLDQLSSELSETKEEIALKLARLEELAAQEPIPIEPDPGIAKANQSISDLTKSQSELNNLLNDIQQRIHKLPTEFPDPIIQKIETISPPGAVKESQTPEEVEGAALDEISIDQPEDISTEDAFSPEPPVTLQENDAPEEQEDDTSEPERFKDDLLTDDLQDVESPVSEKVEEEAGDDIEKSFTKSDEKFEEVASEAIELEEPGLPEEEIVLKEEILKEPEEASAIEEPEELDLGLPDPEETLRKVDALLAGESTSPREESKIPAKPKSTSGVTSIIANVMIGIGNKPYVRGEGPGLSWEEGAPMNFVEIGKWAWSPSRKNATVTIQIYRNDQDPDQGGKYEVKPGEKFEVTPDFG